jgi:hypothetical protein
MRRDETSRAYRTVVDPSTCLPPLTLGPATFRGFSRFARCRRGIRRRNVRATSGTLDDSGAWNVQPPGGGS